MIEQAIRHALITDARILAAAPEGKTIRAYAVKPPDHVAPPFIVFRQSDVNEVGGFDISTVNCEIELHIVPPMGLDQSDYLVGKKMAGAVRDVMTGGIETQDFCIRTGTCTHQQDMIDPVNGQHWVMAKYMLTYEIDNEV